MQNMAIILCVNILSFLLSQLYPVPLENLVIQDNNEKLNLTLKKQQVIKSIFIFRLESTILYFLFKFVLINMLKRARPAKLTQLHAQANQMPDRAKEEEAFHEPVPTKKICQRPALVLSAPLPIQSEGLLAGPGGSRVTEASLVNKKQKNTCRFDYNPELCKDYFTAGYCVFGNSCLYIHDRADYKSGWQLEKEWQAQQEQKRKQLTDPNFKNRQKEQRLKQSKPPPLELICCRCKASAKQVLLSNCRHLMCQECLGEAFRLKEQCRVCRGRLNGLGSNAEEYIGQRKKEHEEQVKQYEQLVKRELG